MSLSHYNTRSSSSHSLRQDTIEVQEIPILITTPPVQLSNPPRTRTRTTPSYDMLTRSSISFSGSGLLETNLYPQSSPNFTSRSPIRDLFRSSRSPPSTSNNFLSPSTRSETEMKIAFDIHLYNFGTHSELTFELVLPSPRSPSSSNNIPLTPLPPRVSTSPLSPSMIMPMTFYRVALEHFDAVENTIVLVCRDDQKNKIANLKTSPKGTTISRFDGDDGYSSISMVEKGHGTGTGYRLYENDQILEWTESTGLAILFDPETRRPLARLNYRVFTKDRLVIIGQKGMESLPLILLSAAKMWFEHQNGKDFRL